MEITTANPPLLPGETRQALDVFLDDGDAPAICGEHLELSFHPATRTRAVSVLVRLGQRQVRITVPTDEADLSDDAVVGLIIPRLVQQL